MKSKHLQGASLIEVLVSLFLLSIMLLSFDAMQLYTLQQTKQSYYVNVAHNQLNNIESQLRLISDGEYQSHVDVWNEENGRVLPNGQGAVSGNYPSFDIQLFWGKRVSTVCFGENSGESGCLSHHLIISNQ